MNSENNGDVTIDIAVTDIVKRKRGRRSKKDIELALAAAALAAGNTPSFLTPENVIVNKNVNTDSSIKIKKPKKIKIVSENNDTVPESTEEVIKPPAKKRGRKPKGGKIIQQTQFTNLPEEIKPNVILHLKCSTKDLQNSTEYNSTYNNKNIESFDFNSFKNELTYEVITKPEKNTNNTTTPEDNGNVTPTLVLSQMTSHVGIDNNIASNAKVNQPTQNHSQYTYNVNELNIEYNTNLNNINTGMSTESYVEYDKEESCESKVIWSKLKILEHNLHVNNISDKKSACFWCSHDFDNPAIYIPKFYLKDSYHVYGCFCSPECATAHLMEENIDSSIKFERYYLINHIYSAIYGYKKNIKPAPNPHYMLEKYYGNLTIQEYRNLLRSERLFLIVDKPLTRILPEFHEDNDEFIINNKIIPSNNYQVKKRLQKKTQPKNIFT